MSYHTSNDSIIDWNHRDDGIVLLTIDDPTQRVNTFNQAFIDELISTVERLRNERESITGVIWTSGKDTFFAGGDLNDLFAATPDQADELMGWSRSIKAALRQLETLGRPVVAAFNGSALGGGLELGLACHRRIAVDRSDARFGTPEVSLGLLPGGGGIVRTVRMLGVVPALLGLLLEGKPVHGAKAVEFGVLDELAPGPQAMLSSAVAWINEHPDATQPWDRPGFRLPGGTPATPAFAAQLPALPATLRKMTNGCHYEAQHHILAVAVESTQVDIDTAFEIEGRYFIDLVCNSAQAKNMMQAFFFDMQHTNGGGSRPDGHPPFDPTRVAVIGAGQMGAGIAYSAARTGLDVVLTDTDIEAAERGKDYSRSILNRSIERGRMTADEADEFLARITPTASLADTQGADVVIEAVFESLTLKQSIFTEVETHVAPDALLSSNTSSLPISELATSVQRRADFIGLHFFSPVDKMPLVEVIRGKATSDATLARALDVVKRLGKTPIVVNDSRGFFTSRAIITRCHEALSMLEEGVSAVSIERAALAAGYPVGPLQLADEIGLQLPRELAKEAAAAAVAAGETYTPLPGASVLSTMVDDFGRDGRGSGAGFYDYDDGTRGRLWSGLVEHYGGTTEIPFVDLKERLLFIEAIETARCFEEGVIEHAADANIGSIMGIGFPPWTGGSAQFIDGYAGGVTGFVGRAKELADRYGNRFVPPAVLTVQAERGESFRRSIDSAD